jgi:hypothetical protein
VDAPHNDDVATASSSLPENDWASRFAFGRVLLRVRLALPLGRLFVVGFALGSPFYYGPGQPYGLTS